MTNYKQNHDTLTDYESQRIGKRKRCQHGPDIKRYIECEQAKEQLEKVRSNNIIVLHPVGS